MSQQASSGANDDAYAAAAEALARFETTPHGVLVVDGALEIRRADAFAQAMFGYGDEDLAGRPLRDLVPAAGADLAPPERGAPPLILHLEGRRHDGSALGLEVALARNGGDLDEVVVAVRDIAPATRHEEHVRRVGQMDLLARFASQTCHDLKNHLMALTGYSELALGRLDRDPVKARKMMEQVLEASERALAYVERMHALGRGRPDGVETLEVGPLLASHASRLRATLPDGVELEFDLDAAEGWAAVQPDSLLRGLEVLLENAAEALGKDGLVVLRAGAAEIAPADALADLPPGRYVTIEVEDSGCGMDAPTRARLFEPFLRSGRDRGRGLGLATLYALCRKLGGGMVVDSSPAKGSRVTLHLPRRERPAHVWPARDDALLRGPGSTRLDATVLIVDDVPVVREIAKEALQEAGYRVLVAASGPEALAIAADESDRIDLLLTDVLMPEMNGAELARSFGDRHPEVPILFMSAYAREPLPTRRGGQPVPFIAKPFSARDLASKVGAVLRGAA